MDQFVNTMQNPDILTLVPSSITEAGLLLGSGLAIYSAGMAIHKGISGWRETHPGWPWKKEPVSLEAPPFKTDFPTFDRKNTQALIASTTILPKPVEAEQLLAYDFDEKFDSQERRNNSQLKGLNFKRAPFMGAAIHRSTGVTEYFGAFMTLVDGIDINKLLLSNSTSQFFGLDTKDILMDWKAIEQTDQDMVDRKARHTRLGLAWDVVARDRDLFGFMIGRDRQPKSKRLREEPRPMILAVTRWEKGPDGRRFLYDLPTDEINQALLEAFLEPTPKFTAHLPAPQCYNPTVGIWVLAHLSPDVKAHWRTRYGFGQRDNFRSNGPAQSGVQTLRFDSPNPKWYRPQDGILHGDFIENAEDYINKHGVPFVNP